MKKYMFPANKLILDLTKPEADALIRELRIVLNTNLDRKRFNQIKKIYGKLFTFLEGLS